LGIGNNKGFGFGIIPIVEGIRLNGSFVVVFICGTDGHTCFGFSICFSKCNGDIVASCRRNDEGAVGSAQNGSALTAAIGFQTSRPYCRPTVANQTVPTSNGTVCMTHISGIGQQVSITNPQILPCFPHFGYNDCGRTAIGGLG